MLARRPRSDIGAKKITGPGIRAAPPEAQPQPALPGPGAVTGPAMPDALWQQPQEGVVRFTQSPFCSVETFAALRLRQMACSTGWSSSLHCARSGRSEPASTSLKADLTAVGAGADLRHHRRIAPALLDFRDTCNAT